MALNLKRGSKASELVAKQLRVGTLSAGTCRSIEIITRTLSVSGTLTGHTLGTDTTLTGAQVESERNIQVRVERNTAATIATATLSQLTWSTATHDTGGGFSAAAPTRLTLPEDGLYLISTQWSFSGHATGDRFLTVLQRNSAGVLQRTLSRAETMAPTDAANPFAMTTSRHFLGSQSDYLEFYLLQTSGGNLTTIPDLTFSNVVRIMGALP